MNTTFLEMINSEALTLIMSLPKNDPELARCAWDNGADAVKVHINVEHRASKTKFGSLSEEGESLSQILSEAKGPVGIVLGGDMAGPMSDFEGALAMGFDFLSLYLHHVPSKVVASKNIIKMFAADYSYTVEEVALFSTVAQVLEASIIRPEDYGTPLNARDILHYKQLVMSAHLPVVVATQKKISVDDLALLKAAGVKGIMTGAVVTGLYKETIARALSGFRERIGQL